MVFLLNKDWHLCNSTLSLIILSDCIQKYSYSIDLRYISWFVPSSKMFILCKYVPLYFLRCRVNRIHYDLPVGGLLNMYIDLVWSRCWILASFFFWACFCDLNSVLIHKQVNKERISRHRGLDKLGQYYKWFIILTNHENWAIWSLLFYFQVEQALFKLRLTPRSPRKRPGS